MNVLHASVNVCRCSGVCAAVLPIWHPIAFVFQVTIAGKEALIPHLRGVCVLRIAMRGEGSLCVAQTQNWLGNE